MANRANIADRKIAAKAIALTRAPGLDLSFSTLILAVTIVLLSGAVWTHAT